MVEKKLGEVGRECKLAERKFERLKTDIWAKLSFLQKSCLISILTDKFKGSAKPVILTHNKKLLNLWKNRTLVRSLNLSTKRFMCNVRPLMKIRATMPGVHIV